jgi:hypothetical protein
LEKHAELLEKQTAAGEALATALEKYTPLKEAYDAMVEAAEKHTSDNAAFVQAAVDAEATVDALVIAAGGSDETAAKQLLLDAVVADTTAAEGAVATQRARIEALIEAKRTQDQEQALWGERVATAQTGIETATTAKETADAALLEA